MAPDFQLEWTPICRVHTERDPESGENLGGIVVYLTDGESEAEFSRVAFARRNSTHPDVSFVTQMETEWARAAEAADVLNDVLEEFVHVEREKVEAAKRKLKEVLEPKGETVELR